MPFQYFQHRNLKFSVRNSKIRNNPSIPTSGKVNLFTFLDLLPKWPPCNLEANAVWRKIHLLNQNDDDFDVRTRPLCGRRGFTMLHWWMFVSLKFICLKLQDVMTAYKFKTIHSNLVYYNRKHQVHNSVVKVWTLWQGLLWLLCRSPGSRIWSEPQKHSRDCCQFAEPCFPKRSSR